MNTIQQLDIKKLIDCQEHIPVLAKLWYEEISRHWIPHSSVEKATQNLIEHSNTDRLPITYVALQNNQAIGMASLRDNDGIRPDLTPWLGSVIVDPKHRNAKVGEALINTVKDQAKLAGHKILYLLTLDPTIPSWYLRLGWEVIAHDQLFGHPVKIMRIAL